MEKRQSGRPTKQIGVCIFLLLFFACIEENDYALRSSAAGETEVTFALKAPGAAHPQSRGITEAEENEVSEIDILVFEAQGGTYVYAVRCDAGDIINGNDGLLKTFTVKLRQGTFDLVILANARALVSPAALSGLSKAAALATLEMVLPSGDKWPVAPFTPFPMWSEVNNILIDEQTDFTGNNQVKIHRLVARADVHITATNFQLTSVEVYNYNTAGRLVPDPSRWDAVTDPGRPKSIAPTVPASSSLIKGPILYNGSAINTSANQCVGEIYLMEAENHSDALHTQPEDLSDRTCLVIGGIWDANGDGDFTNDGAPTYYRVDFSIGSGTTPTYLDVLRNHQYVFNITKVSGYGYDDSHTAFLSAPFQIESELLVWNDSGMDDVQIDGDYYFSVSPIEQIFWKEAAADNQINVRTNYPTWMYTVTDSPDMGGSPVTSWLATSGYSPMTEHPSSPGGHILIYDVTENNSATRTAYLHISAGRFTAVSRVIQHPWQIDRIYVTPTGTIDPAGETRQVHIEGRFDDTPVRATDLATGMDITTGTVPAGSPTGSAELPIPAWMSGERTVAFEYFDTRSDSWQVIRTDRQQTDPTQSIYVTIPGFTTGQAIAPQGETFPLEITGNWPALEIRAVDAAGNPVATPVSVSPGAGTDTNYTITVEASQSLHPKMIYFQWSLDGSVWYSITTGRQTGFDVEVRMPAHTDGDFISRSGDDFTVTVEGYYPALQFRAAVASVPVSSITSLPAGSTVQTTTITVPENDTNANRTILFQYSSDGGTNWTYISSGIQPSIHMVLTTGVVVAVENVRVNGNTGNDRMTWAEAMGIPLIYNTTHFYKIHSGGTDPTNRLYTAWVQTGCHAYAEVGYPAGSWRVPRKEEVDEMFKLYLIISGSCGEVVSEPLEYDDIGLGPHMKSNTRSYRCVRK